MPSRGKQIRVLQFQFKFLKIEDPNRVIFDSSNLVYENESTDVSRIAGGRDRGM